MEGKIAYLTLCLTALISTFGIFFFYFPIKSVPIFIVLTGFCIVLALYVIFYRLYFHDLRELPYKQRGLLIFFSSLLAIFFLISSSGNQDYLSDNSFVIVMLTYCGSFLFISFLIIFVTMFALSNIANSNVQNASLKNFAVYFMMIFLAGIFYWAAFYPAAMSYDSMWSWNQVHTKEFNDWHPIMFTWLILGLTYVWDSPAMVTIFQIVILALIYAYSFSQLQKLGLNKYLLVFTCILLAFSPPFGNYTIVIWKDVLYSGCLLFFTVHLFLIVRSKGSWLISKGNIALFILSSFGVIFFRHNGFPVYLLTMLILFLFYWKYVFKRALPLFLCLVIFHQILTGPIFTYFNIESSDPNEALAIPTQQIGNVIKNDGKLTEQQLEYFNSIMPIHLWKENYYPHTVDYIKFHGEYDRDVIIEDYPLYFKMWGNTVLQNPKLALEAFFNQTSLVWQIRTPEGFSLTFFTDMSENDVGLERKPLSSFLSEKLTSYLEFSRANPILNFVWRPASYAFIIFVFAIAFFMKNGWKAGVVLLPFLLNMLSVTAALPAQDFRYLFANVLISFIFPLMALIKPNIKEE
ncbi:DUF6020 family protein [Bacillus marasmi]|uniref:DUF6020 family protein n=1 Tax=Bacillus marasmi TaxID=1926279 RepID=UPI0011C9011D|nr:DUF6020 family protein [Bacillus marasmi]